MLPPPCRSMVLNEMHIRITKELVKKLQGPRPQFYLVGLHCKGIQGDSDISGCELYFDQYSARFCLFLTLKGNLVGGEREKG